MVLGRSGHRMGLEHDVVQSCPCRGTWEAFLPQGCQVFQFYGLFILLHRKLFTRKLWCYFISIRTVSLLEVWLYWNYSSSKMNVFFLPGLIKSLLYRTASYPTIKFLSVWSLSFGDFLSKLQISVCLQNTFNTKYRTRSWSDLASL